MWKSEHRCARLMRFGMEGGPSYPTPTTALSPPLGKGEMRFQLASEMVEEQKFRSHEIGLEFKSQQTLYNEVVKELYNGKRLLGSGMQGYVVQVAPNYCVKICSREGVSREFKNHKEIYHGYLKIRNSEYPWVTKPRNTNFDERVQQGQSFIKLLFNDDGHTWKSDMPDRDDNWMRTEGLLIDDNAYVAIVELKDIKKNVTVKVRFVRPVTSFIDWALFKQTMTMYYVPLHKLGFYAQDIAGHNIQTLHDFITSTGGGDLLDIVARDIGKSLRQLHMIGFTHQDLHFSNVLVVHHTHTTPRIKLIDWGMAEKIKTMEKTIDVSKPGEDIATYYSPKTKMYERIEFRSGLRQRPPPKLLQKEVWKNDHNAETAFDQMKAGWLAG